MSELRNTDINAAHGRNMFIIYWSDTALCIYHYRSKHSWVAC